MWAHGSPEHRQQLDRPGEALAANAAVPDELWSALYERLKRLAHNQLQREPTGHTLDTTALVHEAYLRLFDQRSLKAAGAAQLIAHVAVAMRRILVDHARSHLAARRGGGSPKVSLDAVTSDDDGGRHQLQLATEERAEQIVALDEALTLLAGVDPRLVQVIEYRFFAGLTDEETAAVLRVSSRTVRRDWLKARAWLQRALSDSDP